MFVLILYVCYRAGTAKRRKKSFSSSGICKQKHTDRFSEEPGLPRCTRGFELFIKDKLFNNLSHRVKIYGAFFNGYLLLWKGILYFLTESAACGTSVFLPTSFHPQRLNSALNLWFSAFGPDVAPRWAPVPFSALIFNQLLGKHSQQEPQCRCP